MIFNLEAAFNGLSFGNISFGLTYELFQRGVSPNMLAIGGGVDLGVFDKSGQEYQLYLQSCLNKFIKNYKKNIPYLKVWHINQSWHKISEPSYLLTFHETNLITDVEVNILNSYNKIFVTSNYSKKVFEEGGVEVPVIYCPMGIDSVHFKNTNKKYFDDDRIVFGIFGKAEIKRKRHKQAVQGWIKKFGGNKKYFLHLHIHNPFFKPEDMHRVYADIFNGQNPPFNVVIYPWQANNSLMNECLNAINIVIDISGGESISLPSLNSVALKKHALIHHNSGMMDWANEENSVLIKSSGRESVVDNIFFFPNSPFSTGEFHTITDDEYTDGLDKVLKRYEKNPINEAGIKLRESYSFKRAVDIILENMK